MATHSLTIAKATFQASLLRPDPAIKALERDAASTFAQLLDSTIHQCSPANVQACRLWICANIIPSSPRIVALGKFLAAVSNSYRDEHQKLEKSISSTRAQLHLLYLINDVLHWQKYHAGRDTRFATEMEASLPQIIALQTASRNQTSHKRVLELLELWKHNGYFTSNFISVLSEAASSENSSKSDNSRHFGTKPPIEGKDAPWIMPNLHGDPSTPYYDLPAANMVPLITPNSTKPINSQRMRPLEFKPGPADKKLVSAVEGLIRDMEHIYDGSSNQEEDAVIPDIDFMGQEIVLDEMGERTGGDTYYGWSRTFCENMRKKLKSGRKGSSRSRSRSQSRDMGSRSSRSRSRSPRKRRRPFGSSRSRSPSRNRRRGRYSSSRSRSRSPSRSRYTADRPQFEFGGSKSSFTDQSSVPPLPNILPGVFPPIPMMNNGTPLPPPRSSNWAGPWPPPPPLPPLPYGVTAIPGFVPPPPPYGAQGIVPPPPPAHNGQERWRDPRLQNRGRGR